MSFAQRIVLCLVLFSGLRLYGDGSFTFAVELPESNRELRTIFNNDTNNVLYAMDSGKSPQDIVADYRRAIEQIAEAQPGVMAQNVGNPDPVIYRSTEATAWSKYIKGHQSEAMNKMLEIGTDPFAVTIEVCHARGIPVVASYRMNAEDFYAEGLEIQDFGRKHKHLAIPGAFCLDPAHPVVYEHRMRIFREVAENYDIEGIEFDFRRWDHMISDPLRNHPILTRMVRETRQMLDEVAKAKGKKRMILGVRVGPSLSTPQAEANYPGIPPTPKRPMELSCRELGLDVKTWIDEQLVDYVSPCLFWPRWPGLPRTREFADLAKGRNVGIYPTVFPRPAWLSDEPNEVNRGPIEPEDRDTLTEYKQGFCDLTLQSYADGADGISMYNWYFHIHLAPMPRLWTTYYGYDIGGSAVQKYVLSIMGDPEKIKHYQAQPWVWPPAYDPLVQSFASREPRIEVQEPKTLPAELPADRKGKKPLGLENDYKPCLALLPNGELLLVAFHTYRGLEDNKLRDEPLVWRSKDQGMTWTDRALLPILGREPYLTVLRDGTVIATSHLVADEQRNTQGRLLSLLHRSTDGGLTWTSQRVDDFLIAGAANRDSATPDLRTSRNVLEAADGTLYLGVSSATGQDSLWESPDRGITWKTRAPQVVEPKGKPGLSPWYAGAILGLAANGDFLAFVNQAETPAPNMTKTTPTTLFRSSDLGTHWRAEATFNASHEVGNATLLRLQDGRLLLTFRSLSNLLPQGVYAVFGADQPAGLSVDMAHDRLVLEQRMPTVQDSGAGYANTVQLPQGPLLTAYAFRDARDKTHVEVVRWQLPGGP